MQFIKALNVSPFTLVLEPLVPVALDLHQHLVEVFAQLRADLLLLLEPVLLLLDQLVLKVVHQLKQALVTLVNLVNNYANY